jgi:hypothetical protein
MSILMPDPFDDPFDCSEKKSDPLILADFFKR